MGAEEIGMQAAGTLLGIGLNQQGNQQQQNQQLQLMGVQHQHQQELNAQMQKIQKENWDYTNYENQLKHMEKAGLNVGLMYGQGGGGGSTMGGASGGTAASGNAPQNTTAQAMGIGLNAAMTQSTMELQKAQANKLNVEADKLKGVDTGNVVADTALKTMNAANAELQNKIQTESYDNIIAQIKANADKAQSEARSAVIGANVTEATQKAQEEQIKAQALNEAFKMAVMKSGINVNEAQIQKMVEDVKIGKFNAQTNADFQGLDKVAGGQLTKLINYFNIKPDNQRKIE